MTNLNAGDLVIIDDEDLGLSIYKKKPEGEPPERICFLNQFACFKLEEWLQEKNDECRENSNIQQFRDYPPLTRTER